MAAGTRYYTPNQFSVDAEGVPIAGAQLFFFITETSTPLDTYSDVGLTTPNTNPVVADANGYFGDIWLTSATAYKVAAYGPNLTSPTIPSTPASPQGTQIWTADPVGPASGGTNQVVTGIIGEIRMFAGAAGSIPSQWYLCYGQAVSRTTYAAAFAVLGTTWGAGDGSTTFNLPDLRGRIGAGKDDMGGSAANRLTAGVSGIPGTTLGGTGGNQHAQQDTLTAISVVTDSGHAHVLAGIPSGSGITAGAISSWSGGGTANTATTNSATTGITVATTVTSSLTGTSQNAQPTAVVNMIVFLGA